MIDNKIFLGVITAVLTALVIYPYVMLAEHQDKIIALEKDREYLPELFNSKIAGLENEIKMLRTNQKPW